MCGLVGRRGRLCAAAIVTGAVVLPSAAAVSPATALATVKPPPGLHIDPGSPAGKQYQIPIPSARHEAAGSKSSTSNPPLFGVGIHPPGGGGGSSHSTTGSSSASGGGTATAGVQPQTASRHSGHRRRAAGLASASSTTSTARSVAPARSSDSGAGGDGWLPLVAGGGLVLLVGGGGGLGLRRRLTRHRPRGTASDPA